MIMVVNTYNCISKCQGLHFYKTIRVFQEVICLMFVSYKLIFTISRYILNIDNMLGFRNGTDSTNNIKCHRTGVTAKTHPHEFTKNLKRLHKIVSELSTITVILLRFLKAHVLLRR